MQCELEADHDAEVAAAATECPKEIWIFIEARCHQAAVSGHHVCGDHVIDAEPVAATQPADPTGKR
jgi:hypothetical protein